MFQTGRMTLILGRHDIGAAVDLDAVLDLLADVPAYTVKVNAKFPAAAPALRGVAAPPSRPSVYSPVGLPWQDLALSWAVYQHALRAGAGTRVDLLA